MIALALVILGVVSVAAHLTIGVALARRSLPAIWAAARESFTDAGLIRSSVRRNVAGMVLAWPFVLAASGLCRAVDRFADSGDPAGGKEIR
jgi:hypothetical protein